MNRLRTIATKNLNHTLSVRNSPDRLRRSWHEDIRQRILGVVGPKEIKIGIEKAAIAAKPVIYTSRRKVG